MESSGGNVTLIFARLAQVRKPAIKTKTIKTGTDLFSNAPGSVPAGEWALIRESLQRGQLTGNQRFVDEVARIAGRRVELRRPGRPRVRRDPEG